MSATLYQVAGAVVPPVADARLYHLLLGQTGVAEGCEVTSLGGTMLHIADGWGVVQGRVWSVPAQDISVTASASGTVKGRLLLRLDTSLEAGSAAQLVTQAAETLPDLNQEDMLSGGSVYELPLATYSVSETSVTDLAMVVGTVSPIGELIAAAKSAADTAQTAAAAAQSKANAALPAASAANFLRVVSFDSATGTLTTAQGVE